MAIAGATERPGFVSQAPKLGFIGGFDGIRGIGILMVLSQHAYSSLFPSAAGIVDMFFVMSAFLIVSLLMQEHRASDSINFRKFYSRRAIRLLPTAYLCIVAWFVFAFLFDRERVVWLVQDALAAVFYVYNIIFPVGLEFVAPTVAAERSIGPYWSLAVEEQFYLFIGITVLVAIRKNWMKQLAWIMVAVATFIGISRFMGVYGPWPSGPEVAAQEGVIPRGLSLLWLSRPDALMWGVALAVLNANMPDPLSDIWKKWLPRAATVAIFAFFGTMALSSIYLASLFAKVGLPFPYVPMVPAPGVDPDGLLWVKFGHTVCALTFAVAMLAMARTKGWWANRWLSWHPLRWLGRQSYTLYVWHTLFFWLILDVAGLGAILGEKTRVFVLVPVAIIMGLPVYYGVEQKMMKLKLRFSSEKEVLDLTTGKMVSIEEASGGKVTAESLDAKSSKKIDKSGDSTDSKTGVDA